MFRLAHLSDVHLAPLPAPRVGQLLNKRLIGFLSWHLRRRKVHQPQIAETIISDIKAAKVDHVALTGDLINIALPQEFERGTRWLGEFGDPKDISFVPGNHDAYIDVAWPDGLAQWQDFMAGDLQLDKTADSAFPYVRQRRNIALIGVSTAVPAALHRASGTLGHGQTERLAVVLRTLRERGFCRVLMIHHPPLAGQAVARKALTDADALTRVLQAEGVELVLHGHNHLHMRRMLQTEHGPAHIIGVPSASAAVSAHKPAAAWYLYSIGRREQRWHIDVEVRNYHGAANTFVPEKPFKLEYE
ncbi:MAG: metallophosphoesterase family protein [Aestuariivirgaceae bacterium]